jgi:hypothetical protein
MNSRLATTLLSPCAARLAESHTLTGPVLIDKFNARNFESPADRHFIGGCK